MYSTAKIPDDERTISAQHSSNSVLRNQSQTPQQTQRSLTEHNILQLQRAIGNQAVSQLFSGAVVKQTYGAKNGSVGTLISQNVASEGENNNRIHKDIQEKNDSGANSHQNSRQTSERFETKVLHQKIPFSATIRRVKDSQSLLCKDKCSLTKQPTLKYHTAHIYNDAPPEQEQEPSFNLASIAIPVLEPIREPEVGETIRVPDIKIPELASIEMPDAIASTLAYNSSITQSGAQPSGFGATRPYTHAISNISITSASGTYNVTATVDNPITFQVRTSTGPNSQLDIASDSDSDITSGNYNDVSSDLTPDMSDLNGRPPRTNFWARDLTIRHERFHASEDAAFGAQGVTAAQTWLNGQTASSAADVRSLLSQVPGRVANTVRVGMAYPGREERAYGDGASAYLARANAIKAKGDRGEY